MAVRRQAESVKGVLGPLAGRRAATTVTPRDEAVRDHLVHSVPVLPGVFLLDTVLRLVRGAGVDPADVELRRVVFLAPVTAPGQGRRVEVTIGAATDDGGLPVTVRSRPADRDDADWLTNCEAELHPAPPRPAARLDVARLDGAATDEVDIDDLYGFVRRLDIVHTGFMKASGTVRVGAEHALARMRLAPEAEPHLGHFHVHPAVLDFATLVPLLLFDPEQRAGADHAFIPIYIESFHAPGGIGPENLVHVPDSVGGQLDADLFGTDLTVCAPDGTVTARMTGFRAKRVRSREQITRLVTADPGHPAAPAPTAPAPGPADTPAGGGLHETVASLVADRLGAAPGDVDREVGFYDLGLTSSDLLGIGAELEDRLGTRLYPTLLFEYPTVHTLAEHLQEEGHETAPLPAEAPAKAPPPALPAPPPAALPPPASPAVTLPAARTATAAAPVAEPEDSPLAVVGLAGRYPGAATAAELWDVVLAGRDCVTEIPADRWDHTPFWDPRRGVPGRSYSKWGAFCDGVAEFDAPFFHLSAERAAAMDPHERLFLQTSWEALEDAGHTPEGLADRTGGAVGVFAGAMWNDYQLNGLDQLRAGTPQIAGSWSSALANRVSHTFDFQGPSLTVDTACSAALTALHLAGESIRRGECRAALVGGVNLSLHPYKYLRLAELGLLSTDGRCRPFGKDADGYVPGEGVGVVLVRPLADALDSGDHVYGVIRGSALRHSGRTGGYSVPSPEAQTRVVSDALAAAGVPAHTVTYLEAHASGTALGDQIEIEALSTAYGTQTEARGFCAIGSSKTSIGHLEAAAGIAGLTKLLMGLRHRTVPPTQDVGGLNPAIRFEGTPFYLPSRAEPWTAPVDPATGDPLPRRAALSAFGAGGANVHLIVEEYDQEQPAAGGAGPGEPVPLAVPVSARTEGQLRDHARRLARHLRRGPAPRLADVAHTLRHGRRPMAHRVALVVRDVAELADALDDIDAGRPPRVTAHQGHASRVPGHEVTGPGEMPDSELAERWAAGRLSSWPAVPGARRVSLPTYPFARDRHWLGEPAPPTPRPEPRALPEPPSEPSTRPDGDRTMLYVPRWHARPLPEGDERAPLAGATVLALDTSDDRAAELRAACGRLIRVRPGMSYARLSDDLYEISPGVGEHYRTLARELRETGAEPAAILHLWQLRAAAVTPPADTGGPLSAFHLCQAWALGRSAPLPVLYGYPADDDGPAHAAVGGLARTLRLEQPKLALKVVRFADARPPVRTLLAEAASALRDASDTEVRHLDSGRTVLGFTAAGPTASGGHTPLARDGGTYLITGGAGGLGRHAARLLASRARVSVALTGRSAPGPGTEEAVAELARLGARAAYLPADVTDPEATGSAVAEATRRFGPLTGVIHCAGVVDDALLVNKTPEAIERVLAPKVRGTVNLDAATRTAELDYLILYSSVASVLGNPGATDYATANRYLDAFAEWREERRRLGERHGRTLAINWPLWRDGGMRVDAALEGLVLDKAGARLLETADGLAAVETALRYAESQIVVLSGDRARLENRLGAVTHETGHEAAHETAPAAVPAAAAGSPPPAPDPGALLEAATARVTGLVRRLANGSGPAPEDDRLDAGFIELGLDSARLVELAGQITSGLDRDLRPTVLFRHPDIRSLAAYLVDEHADAVAARWARPEDDGDRPAGDDHAPETSSPNPAPAPVAPPDGAADDRRPVAVIGMAGRFPGSHDPDGFWADLAAGRDLITPVPGDRWDHALHLDPTGTRPGLTDCGHGAFLDDVARFDARFFGMPRAAAEGMDPQARLLLEVLYEAAEDAGVAPALRGSATGSFLGQCFNDYDHEMVARGRTLGAYDVTGTSVAMAANRPSYFFDLTGPSMTVDTACSSSLYALHLAVTALRRGECEMAFAAGANLILSPEHYLRSAALGALSPSGSCHSFDARADGYVPGEAVAAVLLKPLDRALADGDPVHAVIRGTAVNHGGRAGSITAPNAARQSQLLLRAWEEAGIDPRTLTYLEAHGTGTSLGDPVEVDAAVSALRAHHAGDRSCALGSAKAHLGHTEGAAGLVSVVKTVLAMRNRLIPAMPDFQQPNPLCELDGPLYVNTEPMPWEPPPGAPRRAGVSSFGFGGAYAHAVLEEAPTVSVPVQAGGPLAFPFSAHDDARLRALVARHREFLAAHPAVRPDRVAATLCRGRETFSSRVVVFADSLPSLLGHLDAFLAGGPDGPRARVLGAQGTDEAARAAARWANGETDTPPTGPDLPRLALPTYPFGGERYWFGDTPATAPRPVPVTAPVTVPAAAAVPAPPPAAARPGSAEHAAAEAQAFVTASGFSGRRAAAAMDRLDALLRGWCRHLLDDGSGPPDAAALRARLADEEQYGRLADALVRMMAHGPQEPPGPSAAGREGERLAADLAALTSEYPELTPWADLVAVCLPRLPAMLAGDVDALEVYFSADQPDLLLRVYDGNAVADHHNEIVARAVAAHVRKVREREPGRPVRLMEIGGGTGGTTRRLLQALEEQGAGVDYTFTDVSPAFLPAARRKFAGTTVAFDTKVLDLDDDPESQGFAPGTADLVIAANSVHASRCVADSLRRIRRLLAPGGVLVLEELVRNRDCMTAMIGPLPGYWASVDQEARLPHSPFLDVSGWRAALAAQGFERTWALGSPDLDETEFDNAVLMSQVPAGTGEDAGTPSPAVAAVAADVPPAGPAEAPAVEMPTGEVPAIEVPVAAAPEPDVAGTRERLRHVFARFFGMPADAVDVTAPFDEFGLDSLSAIQLVRELEPDFGPLPKVLLYEHPTLEALADHLAALASPPATPPPGPSPEAAPPAALPPAEPAPASPAPAPAPAPEAAPPTSDHPVERNEPNEPVAIVGMAGRFAKSPDLTTWWRHLRDGVHLVSEIPATRFDWREVYGDPTRTLGAVDSRWGSFCDGVDRFDATFFGMTPLEAELMDPQQRIMLEVAWHAVEDSGHRPADLRGSRTGVFIGATSHDYDWQLQRAGRHREGHVVSGTGHCLIANRISYQLDLRGPSEAVDTACSSSLTALHRAVRGIQSGECDGALVGGVHLFLTPDLFVALGQLGIMSPDGRCAAFDRKANGMVRGEGAVAVVLKPLSRALADGDTVYALVRGSGVSHGGGGHMDSLMMPNPGAQAELIESVYAAADVDPRTISYVEAHGTGTEVGDPIELRGLRKAFASLTGVPESEPVSPWCGIGTVKSNVGHTEAAAGLTGVVKTVLALWHRELPPSLHFTEPNPLLDIENSPFHVVQRRTPWTPPPGAPRRAGVSAFGLGGTNAHVLLEEHPRPAEAPEAAGPYVVPLSARTQERLRAYVRKLYEFLRARASDDAPAPPLSAVAATLRAGRDPMEYRLAVVATSTGELVRLLGEHLDGSADPRVFTGRADRGRPPEAAEHPADAVTAARGWVTGGPEWRPPDGPGTPRRVSLPGYPFEPQRHWAEPRDSRPTAPADGGREQLPELLRALTEGRVSVDEAELLMEGMS